MFLTYYFLNILFIGYCAGSAFIWDSLKSILGIAVFLASCILMVTSLFGSIQDLSHNDDTSWFDPYHKCITDIWNPLVTFFVISVHETSTQFLSNCPFHVRLCDFGQGEPS